MRWSAKEVLTLVTVVILQKNYQQVVRDCSMALELNPRYVKALSRRAKAFESLEQFRESLEGQ